MVSSSPIRALRLLLGDQLSGDVTALEGLDVGRDVVMLCELEKEATYVPHHPKKIAFLFAAMRHFAEYLKVGGVCVRYVRLDDPDNSGDFSGEITRALEELKPERVIVTEPGEWRIWEQMRSWADRLGVPVEIRPDDRFLCRIDAFRTWSKERRQLRMEYFYRMMRERYALLMDASGKPTGGVWNFDKENRKPPKAKMVFPARPKHVPDKMTKDVITLVKTRFSAHFGTLEPFAMAVTREGALKDLEFFITRLLPDFGDYQDAMLADEAFLYHSHLSAYLNAGLLLPLECCKAAEAAYVSGKAPLNAAEGFIRQILGWREYMRGIYWTKMPKLGEMNALAATRPLPDFYWTAETEMFCVAEAVRQTRDHAYSHHIQRLMVTGNFALLAGLDVGQVCEWYLSVYIDAYEWVELPNTLGMALFADGGIVGSKPYAASGKYIHRMSDSCARCRYDPNETLGETACPFNSLYWHFLARNEAVLGRNARLFNLYAGLRRMDAEKRSATLKQAENFLQTLDEMPRNYA